MSEAFVLLGMFGLIGWAVAIPTLAYGSYTLTSAD